MAIQNDGIMGVFKGQVGTVVGAGWRGKHIIKKRPTINKNRKPTDAQLVQQAKFALANKFFKRFTRLLRVSFEGEIGNTQRGAAFRTMLKEAITGTYPNFSVDYSKVQVAKGGLEPAQSPAVVSNAPGKLSFNWTDNSLLMHADPHDVAILVAYCEEMNALIFSLNGSKRLEEVSELDVPYFTGKEVQTWIAFRSLDAKKAADSIYTGAVMVS